MTIKEFKSKIENEYNRLYVAKLANIGFNVYSHDTEHPRKDLIGYCIPTSEDSFEFFIQPDIKTGLEKLNDSILLSGGYNSMNINKLKIIGGTSLKDLNSAFEMCDIRTLDLSLLDTSNVLHMDDTFYSMSNKKLILPEIILLENLETACNTFLDMNTTSIEIRNIKLNKLKSVKKAFSETKADKIIIENVSLNNLESADGIFCYATVDEIRLLNIKSPRLKYLLQGFAHAKISHAILDIDTSKINSFTKVFYMSKIDKLDISNWRDNDKALVAEAFEKCKIAEEIIMDSKKHPSLFNEFTKNIKE